MRSLRILVGLVLISQSAAQSQGLSHDEGYCQNELYARQFHAYRASEKPDYRMVDRSASGDLELRFYIDTSYERKRAGGYNRNDSVQNYLSILVDSVRTLFNRAAPVWDLGTHVDFVFFDGATPFGYGISPAETLINFFEWLDSQGFPGSKDSYVFYSGKYTNQGVSFVGEMCLPGSAMVGYVSDFNSNVNLSSHEWIGHNANSGHYNSEPNIMNASASRPWIAPSLAVIENYLDQQSCVLNIQPPLASSFESFALEQEDMGAIRLEWSFPESPDITGFYIERKAPASVWEFIHYEAPSNQRLYVFWDHISRSGDYYYRVYAENHTGHIWTTPIRHLAFEAPASIWQYDGQVWNPQGLLIRIHDARGRLIKQSRDSQVLLTALGIRGLIFISSEDGQILKCISG